jgi:aquaporin Z
MIYAVGGYSGGHFNPAVSFAVWTRGGLRADRFVGYVLAQLAAAAAAGLLLAAIFPDEVSLASLGTPLLPAKISLLKGGAIEAVITFLLVSTVLFVTREDSEHRGFAGLAIGATLVGLILFAGPVTGGSANPARYLGPALAAGKLESLPAHVLGPLVGAAVASAVFWFVTEPSYQVAAVSPAPVEPAASVDEPAALPFDRAQLVQIARAQFESGHWKEAAQALVPILWQFDSCDRELRKQVASLLLVIEAEAGALAILDPYRSLVFSGGRAG